LGPPGARGPWGALATATKICDRQAAILWPLREAGAVGQGTCPGPTRVGSRLAHILGTYPPPHRQAGSGADDRNERDASQLWGFGLVDAGPIDSLFAPVGSPDGTAVPELILAQTMVCVCVGATTTTHPWVCVSQTVETSQQPRSPQTSPLHHHQIASPVAVGVLQVPKRSVPR
jgi:hypothetical protein